MSNDLENKDTDWFKPIGDDKGCDKLATKSSYTWHQLTSRWHLEDRYKTKVKKPKKKAQQKSKKTKPKSKLDRLLGQFLKLHSIPSKQKKKKPKQRKKTKRVKSQ